MFPQCRSAPLIAELSFTMFTRSMNLRSSLVVVLLLSAVVARADDTDEAVRAEMKRQNIPGLSLAVIRNGKVIKTAGYGVADMESKSRAIPETVYHIGSIGKQFVAAGIMLLVQDGRVRLDDSVAGHLPDAPAAWRPITVRHLLTHTSGIVRDVPALDTGKYEANAQLVRRLYPVPLRFTPGDKWEYSNAAYSVLAEIMERATGRPWSEFLRERIFDPFGMNATYPTNTAAAIPQRARGYTDNNKLLTVDHWKALYPAGGFLSTVLDLAKWDAALSTDRPLTSSSRREMWTAVVLNDGTTYPYGLGFELDSPLKDYGPIGALKTIGHGGSLKGFRSEYRRFRDNDVSVILLMNSDDVDWRATLYRVASPHVMAVAPALSR
jgi:D-alanyl-D-alanine carboxypeptidase